MGRKRFFWLSYHAPRDNKGRLSPHLVRDGAAFAELSSVLHSLGFSYGGLLLNPPGPLPAKKDFSERHLPARVGGPKDWEFLTPGDLLVLPTRPPLDDLNQADKKAVERSFTWLECQVFLTLDSFFGACARSHIRLGESLKGRFLKGFENRYEVWFHQYWGAWSTHMRRAGRLRQDVVPEPPPFVTAGYLLHAPVRTKEWPNGPRLLAAFGMGGTETLIWTRLLGKRKRLASVIAEMLRTDKRRLLVGELTGQGLPDAEHLFSSGFAEQWKVSVILDATL